jgi:transcription elongation factor Elf1
VCGGKYRTKGLLVSHKRSHEERQFQCYHCNKMFVNRETIDGHMVKHMKYLEAKFKCSYCDKMYLTLRKLVDHERFHKRKGFGLKLGRRCFDSMVFGWSRPGF